MTIYVFRQDVMCDVGSLTYDFKKRAGTLTLAPGHCVDMSGCINLFKVIDPDAVRIQTIADNRKDTSYVRDHAGQWQTFFGDE